VHLICASQTFVFPQVANFYPEQFIDRSSSQVCALICGLHYSRERERGNTVPYPARGCLRHSPPTRTDNTRISPKLSQPGMSRNSSTRSQLAMQHKASLPPIHTPSSLLERSRLRTVARPLVTYQNHESAAVCNKKEKKKKKQEHAREARSNSEIQLPCALT
jgi:hypothetical protein